LGLLELTRIKVVSVRRGNRRRHFDPYDSNDQKLFSAYIKAVHGGSMFERSFSTLGLLREMGRKQRAKPASQVKEIRVDDYRSKFCRRRQYPIPTFSFFLFNYFGTYLRTYLRRNFHAVRISKGGPVPQLPQGPVIFYSNHPSWWDAVVMFYLAHSYFPDRAGYAPMDADMLKKHGFFKRLGIFGVEDTTFRGAATFMCTSWNVLSQPNTALWITAEGQFTDARRRPVRLRPGLSHLVRKIEHVTVVPIALEYTFWTERFPEALIRFGLPIPAGHSLHRSVKEWTAFFEQSLEQTMDTLAADAMNRDTAAFDTLIAGQAGVGGIYDLWRRLKAFCLGRPFQPEHTKESP
jgi:1-acyl-sn-glycerol-3-phosphate acyltransferase